MCVTLRSTLTSTLHSGKSLSHCRSSSCLLTPLQCTFVTVWVKLQLLSQDVFRCSDIRHESAGTPKHGGSSSGASVKTLYSCINAHLSTGHVHALHTRKQTHCKSDLITLIMHFWSICQQTMRVFVTLDHLIKEVASSSCSGEQHGGEEKDDSSARKNERGWIRHQHKPRRVGGSTTKCT